MSNDYLTKEKFAELSAELERLRTTGRQEVAGRLEYAKSLGDLSENAEYQEAREAFTDLEERIAKIEDVLKQAVIVKEKHGTTVDIGSKVVVKKNGGVAVEYSIVGSEEAEPKDGKISNESPIGAAMIGKKAGDTFIVKTPSGQTASYSIVEIK
ncbi:MAG: transcription elongation factor GreA [Candidatus Paceibacterota bacterium]|jgi:transcription elongation factor GreA